MSSAATSVDWLKPGPDSISVWPALDAGGSAPLLAVSSSTTLAAQPLLTADDAALILRVPKSFVYALARRGELPTVRVGERYVRFRREALERWIVECETTERRGTQ